MNTILFYRTVGTYGCFSNFSRHPVILKNRVWKTSEHYFQAQKFAGTLHEDAIYHAATPGIAAGMGRDRNRPLRSDWEKVKDEVMYQVVRAKFWQNEQIRKVLLATNDDVLVEHTKNDKYWGDGGDGSGKNMLGIILMRVRQEFREADKIWADSQRLKQ